MADSTFDYNVGARHQYTTWDGRNDSTGNKFDSEANMIGIDATVRYSKFFGGISLVGGRFEFKANAPDRPTAPNPASAKTTIKRVEFNLITGYQITRYFSVFTDLQNITNDWKGEDYTVDYTGFGIGANGNYPVAPNWIIYGSIGYIPLTISEPEGTEIGDGRGVSLEIGGSYVLKNNMALSLSLKAQSREFDYDNAPDQTHDVGGLLFRYNYTFQ